MILQAFRHFLLQFENSGKIIPMPVQTNPHILVRALFIQDLTLQIQQRLSLFFPPHINPMRSTPSYVNQFRIRPPVQVLPRLVLQQSGKVSVFSASDIIMSL